MPFTPFHFGPGLLLKGLARSRFSFVGYAASQVVIDVESGYFLATGQWPVHRTLHTFLVGSLAGAATGLVVATVGRQLRWCTGGWPPAGRAELQTTSAVIGGTVGGIAHSLLDGLMHPDIRPFLPFTGSNPLLGQVALSTLYWGCVLTGVVGLVLLWRPRLRQPTT
jgi:hypothetical protein